MRNVRAMVILVFLAMALLVPMVAMADPEVTLMVLNPPNAAGDIIVVRGDDIEVEFDVTDPPPGVLTLVRRRIRFDLSESVMESYLRRKNVVNH